MKAANASQLEIGLKFKHAGCSVPLGFCLTKPIGKPRPQPPKPLFSLPEIEEGWGGALVSISNNEMTIIPYRKAHNDEEIVVVTDDIEVDASIANDLGFNEITIHSGNYNVDLSGEESFGKITVNITTN